ncbi:C40 family peptidase [Weeksellaceae bacterium TAE3-ERU29]|nr:C40 family peptidase [Weeksellaceae bacterium TAE3-ERU29]
MKKLTIVLFAFFLIFESCGSIRRINKNKPYTTNRSYTNLKEGAKMVLDEAYSFLGTPYQYGGVTSSGMDCSGLLLNAYRSVNIQLPRISRDQADFGEEIRLSRVEPGDALFFNTSGSRISHAGIVDRVEDGEVFFIHASSSQGVIVSSLENSYWKKRFVKAVRFLN